MELSAAANVSGTNQRARVDRDAGLLVGSGCGACGATSWPPRAICHRCGHPMELDHALPRDGTLLSFTEVRVSRPGLDAPYTLGQIEIGDAMFFGHVRELPASARVPMPVRVVVAPEETGALSFWFEPA